MFKNLFALVVFCLTPMPSLQAAQMQDVVTILNQRLATKGHVTRQRWVEREVEDCNWGCCGKQCSADCYKCRKKKENVLENFTDVPTLAAIEIRQVSDLVVDKTKITQMPEEIHRKEVVFLNCSKSEQSFTQGFSLAVTTSESVTMTKSVANGLSATAKVDWDFGAYGKYGISVTGSRTVTVTDSSTQGASKTETHQYTIPLKVQPGNIGTGSLWVFTLALEAPFSGTIVFDGPLVANLEGYVHASQFLSEAERTIQIDGVLAVTSASQSFNGTWEDKASEAQCASRTGTSNEFREYVGTSGTISTAINLYRGFDKSQLKKLNLGEDGRSLTRREWQRTQSPQDQLALPDTTGTPGNYCYIGPCNRPLDGYRPVCRYDEDGACFDCAEESDSVCDPEPPEPPEPPTKDRDTQSQN